MDRARFMPRKLIAKKVFPSFGVRGRLWPNLSLGRRRRGQGPNTLFIRSHPNRNQGSRPIPCCGGLPHGSGNGFAAALGKNPGGGLGESHWLERPYKEVRAGPQA